MFYVTQIVDFYCRSKKETERLHLLNKPVRKAREVDDLPSIESHDEDQDSWSSGIEDISLAGSIDERNLSSDEDPEPSSRRLDSDVEMPYETATRKRYPSWEFEEDRSVQRLPIKLPDGRIQRTWSKSVPRPVTQETDEESEEDKEGLEQLARSRKQRVEDVSTGARFGRPAVVDVIGNKSKKGRIQGAKDQIAGICQEILAEPENSVNDFPSVS
jgi:nucleolar complex protein 3